MSLTAVELAQAKGWRHVYANVLTIPYWIIHAVAIAGIAITGLSWHGLVLALAFYVPRMFFVTGAYHRYFSHRSFKTSRWFQLVLAVGATLTTQKGPLWWAAHHRVHHKMSDEPGDLHSVKQSGFWWAHHGWILTRDLEGTDLSRIKDFGKFPELVWLNRWWMLPPIALGAATWATLGFHGFAWGFCLGQVLCWHGTFTINSLSHLWGSRRYATDDDSRNNLALAILTMGEGWHNNHHHFQASARQGFFWWEIDVTYYVLRALATVGLIWELRSVPDHVRDGAPDRQSVPAVTETADMA
ncbi:MAG TPA: acyl-CoA desaturase [Kofleriaceae bacterium]|nr:acyl-CoA desaturase [Kofleriaceae bacterium]